MEAILAIGEQESGADQRARAIMAALCLADEPSVSEDIAHRVLGALIAGIKETDAEIDSPLNAAITELERSDWSNALNTHLVDEFVQRRTKEYITAGLLAGQVLAGYEHSPQELAVELVSEDEVRRTKSMLELVCRSYTCYWGNNPADVWFSNDFVPILMANLESKKEHLADSSAWALGWLLKANLWVPSNDQLEVLTRIHNGLGNSFLANLWIATIFARHAVLKQCD